LVAGRSAVGSLRYAGRGVRDRRRRADGAFWNAVFPDPCYGDRPRCSSGGFGPTQLDFLRNLSDGTHEAGPGGLGWRVPAGQALVITDVDWSYVHPQGAAAAGVIETLRLFVESLATPSGAPGGPPPVVVFESTIT